MVSLSEQCSTICFLCLGVPDFVEPTDDAETEIGQSFVQVTNTLSNGCFLCGLDLNLSPISLCSLSDKEIQDLKICSHADSLILSLTVLLHSIPPLLCTMLFHLNLTPFAGASLQQEHLSTKQGTQRSSFGVCGELWAASVWESNS